MSELQLDAIFVSWIGHHGRSAGIAEALGIESHFLPGGSGPAPVRYVRAWRATRRLLRSRRPRTIIVMLPPPVALAAVAMAVPSGVRVVGDLHTGVFTNPKWRWALAWQMRVLRRRGFALVTGADLARRAAGFGVRALQLHDIIERPAGVAEQPDEPGLTALLRSEYVLVPLAYSFDEPIDALLEAARRVPSVKWVLTGKAPAEVVSAAPSNVFFSGFVSRGDYARLVQRASALAALTTQEDTMQRVGYEALSEGKALITSGTAVLREFFGPSALYVSPDPTSIATQAKLAMRSRVEMEQRMRERREELRTIEAKQLSELRVALRG